MTIIDNNLNNNAPTYSINKSSPHWQKINKKVWEAEWDSLEDYIRDTISNDTDQKTYILRVFSKFINNETTRLFEDENYPYNSPHTFRNRRKKKALRKAIEKSS